MEHKIARHPLCIDVKDLDEKIFNAMWEIFYYIGKLWGNMHPTMDDISCKLLLYSFMLNRINMRPIYREYYSIAVKAMEKLIEENGGDKDKAYKYLFTDRDLAQTPPETLIALTRQLVANEFMALQLSLGSFKAFGATNYCGYIGGAYIPGQPLPYRPFEEKS